MSVSYTIAGTIKITPEIKKQIDLYNLICTSKYEVPEDLINELKHIFGDSDKLSDKLPIKVNGNTAEHVLTFEVSGDPMYGDGMMVDLDSLHPDTISLRIYAEA